MTTQFDFLPTWPLQAAPSLWMAVALVAAVLVGELFARTAWLPRMTGYIVTGLVVGPGMLAVVGGNPTADWRPIVELALGILLFELGTRVNLRWLVSNPWLLVSSLLEAGLSFLAVFVILRFFGTPPAIAATAATITIATSPSVVVRIAAELRAQGQVTERLMLHTALNSIYAAVGVNLMVGVLHHEFRGSLAEAVLYPVYLLCGSVLVGAGFALVFRRVERWLGNREEVLSFLLLGMVALTVSASTALKVPPLLPLLLAGVVVRHIRGRPLVYPPHFGSAGAVLIIVMFVVSGTSIALQPLMQGAAVAVALVLGRVLAKIVGVLAIAKPSSASWRQATALGVGLAPLSRVALLLTLDTATLFPEFGAAVLSALLGSIIILELIGPVMTFAALKLAGEATP
jgi:Kef-type K+ transport system membrane component KefB